MVFTKSFKVDFETDTRGNVKMDDLMAIKSICNSMILSHNL